MTLRVVLAAASLAMAPAGTARADPLDRWAAPIAEAAVRFGVPDAWIRRVMRAESGGFAQQAGRPIRSRAGAIGLMQLMPATWRSVRAAHGLGSDPDDPRDNILAGTAYLRAMYDRFGYPAMFAAYNAGPARLAAHLERAVPLPTETVAYVAKVAGPDMPISGLSAVPPRRAPREGIFAIRGLGTTLPALGGEVGKEPPAMFFALRPR